MFQIVAQEVNPALLKGLFSIHEVVSALKDSPQAENLAISMSQLPTPAPHLLGNECCCPPFVLGRALTCCDVSS